MGFRIKQILKMAMQHLLLPLVYRFWRLVYRGRKPDLILFADAHHDQLPFSMEVIHEELERRGYPVVDAFCDYAKKSMAGSALHAISFMRLYARARCVFICDNFLPVASCAKENGTTVVQLLHSCGLLKKMGYDTTEDIPDYYRGHVYRNYDLVTVSAPCCVEPLGNAMGQPEGIVQALGVSRTDRYFDETWHHRCRTRFAAAYPDLVGKKLILWAPTFRGNAADPHQVGMEALDRLEKILGPEYHIIRKVHPHVDGKYHLSNCDIPTEELFPVVDLLISDYSSVVCEFLLFRKPCVLFAPDLEEYEKTRGFYVPYDTLSDYIVTDGTELPDQVKRALSDPLSDRVETLRRYHLGACDGHATTRILDYIGL